MQVIGLGNAIVDVISNVEEEFITEFGLEKGGMTLIDADRALELSEAMPNATTVGGGSAANTIVGVASLGGTAGYFGKVRDDDLGVRFREDLHAAGVAYDVALATEGPPTARSLIQVTPDAQRTLNTFLGISADLSPDDLDFDLIAASDIVYCEGYLYDTPPAKRAIREAMACAAEAGRQVSLTLSDSFCVERHREDFLSLIGGDVTLLFANETEILSLYQTNNFDEAAALVGEQCELSFLTRSALGSVIVANGEQTVVDAFPVESVVDSTGAGDLFASGVLFGIAEGYDLPHCARLGSMAAAEVISHLGPRPLVSLRELAASFGLIDS